MMGGGGNMGTIVIIPQGFASLSFYFIGEKWKKELEMCCIVLTSKDCHYQMKHLIKLVRIAQMLRRQALLRHVLLIILINTLQPKEHLYYLNAGPALQ